MFWNGKKLFVNLLVSLIFCLFSSEGMAQWHIDFENGLVFSGYNDVRIPGNTGTLLSLSEDLQSDPAYFYRLTVSYSLSTRHTISVLIAPLRLESEGRINRQVRFQDQLFSAGILLKSIYQFDSYRLRYRYDFYQTDKFMAGIGVTAKIRDASISIASGNQEAEKKNTGFVPLINFKLKWIVLNRLSLLFTGDALAAPQGRAEDVLLALHYQLNDTIGLKTGYRILEGGADNDEVYTFALLNYAVIGAVIVF